MLESPQNHSLIYLKDVEIGLPPESLTKLYDEKEFYQRIPDDVFTYHKLQEKRGGERRVKGDVGENREFLSDFDFVNL
jgi:hypothetical protein